MSVRVYTGPHADRRRGGGGGLRALPWVLALLTIGAQIAWPLTSGSTRDSLTIAANWAARSLVSTATAAGRASRTPRMVLRSATAAGAGAGVFR